MKIKDVRINNRAKFIEVDTAKGSWRIPYAKLRVKPTSTDPFDSIYVDKELGREAVTYQLKSGREDSIHVDAFLDYNADPDYLLELEIYRLSLLVNKLFEKSSLTKKELERRLETSRSQLNRLFDPAYKKKSLDQIFRLLCALDAEPKLETEDAA